MHKGISRSKSSVINFFRLEDDGERYLKLNYWINDMNAVSICYVDINLVNRR